MRLFSPVLFALAACSPSQDGLRPTPSFRPDSAILFDAPWPDDARVDSDGSMNFDGFPHPSGNALIERYFDFGEQQLGYGTNSPIYLRLDGPVDPALLPSPLESLGPDSAIILVDIDPSSAYFGERFPIRWQESAVVSAYQPEGLFAVAPYAGFPLRGDTRYALLLTTKGFLPTPEFRAVFQDGNPRAETWSEVEDLLPLLGLSRSDLAIGTVFTTVDPLADMKAIARYVQTRLEPPRLDAPLEHLADYEAFSAYRMNYQSPVFTHGERPFNTEGGDLRFDANGDPIIASWDEMRMAVCLPIDNLHPPNEGWPVVIYQHGTGGAYRGLCNSNGRREVARIVGDVGFIALGIDQPLHGPRAGESNGSDLANFNILNPDSGTTNFPQGAADALYLARALARRPTTFTLPSGREIVLDPDRVHFMGHSQGGMTGAIAAAFWAGDVKASVLSGAGGLLSITLIDRKDILDFSELVRGIAEFTEEEELNELHPVSGLVQMLVERSDMVNYAPYWFSQPLDYPGHQPASVILTNGTLDANTPYRTAVALAVAGRLPPLHPRATSMEGMQLRNIPDSQPMTRNNALGYEGPITAAFSQWQDGTHFVVFQEDAAAGMYQRYLQSSAEGEPSITLVQDPPWTPPE